MRIGVFSLAVIGLVSGGLAIRATSDVNYAFVDAFYGLSERIAERVAGTWNSLCPMRSEGCDIRPPGRTRVVVAGGGAVLGLDADGYVTWYGTECSEGDLPALTGFFPTGSEPGVKLSTPEVVLGLTIVRAFELAPTTARMLSEVNLADLEHPSAILSGGLKAELGQGGYAAKVKKLSQVLLQARELNMHVNRVDLRFGRQVIVEWDQAPRGYRKEV